MNKTDKKKLEEAIKLQRRLEGFFGSAAIAIVFSIIAYLLHTLDGALSVLYWLLCVLAITSAIRAVWILITARSYLNMILIVILAIIVNIPLQMYLSSL